MLKHEFLLVVTGMSKKDVDMISSFIELWHLERGLRYSDFIYSFRDADSIINFYEYMLAVSKLNISYVKDKNVLMAIALEHFLEKQLEINKDNENMTFKFSGE